MDDLELDRTLRNALDVAPSPAFVARVRATIADAPPPSLLAGALKPAAAIAGVVVLAIVVGLPREEARLKPSPTEIALSPAKSAVTAGPSAVARRPSASFGETRANVPSAPAPAVPAFRSALAKARRSAKTTMEPSLPEVIIAREDITALRQFVAAANEVRFLASFDGRPISTPWVMTELTIAPIIIEPLDAGLVHNN